MRFLTHEQVLRLHAAILRASGGESGLLTPGSLANALERCRFGPFPEEPDLALRGALLLRGIAQDHPFVDGNKRTAFAAAEAFLRINGHRLAATSEEVVSFMLSVAMARLDVDAVAGWLVRHSQPLSSGGGQS